MCAWKYKQIMPKLTIKKQALIKPKKITNMVGASLQHIASELEKTSYRTEIQELDTQQLSSLTLEEALIRHFIKTCEATIELSPRDIRSLLSAILMKFEANCIKALLRAKEAGLSGEEAMSYIIPAGRLTATRCTRILENCDNIGDIVDALSDMEYGLVLEKAFDVYIKENNFYLLEVALDRHVYRKLWGATGEFWGLDRKIARTIVGLEIDSVNVKTVLRCKAMEISGNRIRQYVIPVPTVFGEKTLEEAINCTDMESTIDCLVKSAKLAGARDYRYVFSEIKESQGSSLTEVETILDRGLLETSLRMVKRYTSYFNIGLLLSFLNMKWFEIRNLRAIIRGSEAQIAPERVKKLLILNR